MMLLAALLGTLSALLMLAAGYLFGVRRGAMARERLMEQSLGQLEDLRRERRVLAEQRDDKSSGLLRNDLVKLLELLLQQGNTLQRMLLPLSRGIGEADNLRSKVEQVLSPLMLRERLESALSSVDTGVDHQSDLTLLLNEVAAVGGFRVVVLSDDQGLPLAHSDNAWDLDRIAGMSAFLLVLAERIARDGAPAPLSLMLHDEENTVILCRAFRVRDARLFLTAAAAGVELKPTALDPTLSRVERILST
jgi:predicted regulator of Ras-like GTPase activity (Roadblock/LC7/MglB family)